MSTYHTTLHRVFAVVALCAFALLPPASAEPPGGAAALVDLNSASAEELVELPRIGPRVAARVIEYREKNGGFRTVDELMNVRGIGQKTFDRLRDLITVADTSGKGKPEPAPAGE